MFGDGSDGPVRWAAFCLARLLLSSTHGALDHLAAVVLVTKRKQRCSSEPSRFVWVRTLTGTQHTPRWRCCTSRKERSIGQFPGRAKRHWAEELVRGVGSEEGPSCQRPAKRGTARENARCLGAETLDGVASHSATACEPLAGKRQALGHALSHCYRTVVFHAGSRHYEQQTCLFPCWVGARSPSSGLRGHDDPCMADSLLPSPPPPAAALSRSTPEFVAWSLTASRSHGLQKFLSAVVAAEVVDGRCS